MQDQNQKTAVSSTKDGKHRKLRFGTVAMISTVLVVVVVMLLNVVMETVEKRYPITIDLTAQGTFSLSEESLKLARGTKNETEIIVFVSEKLFTADDYKSYDGIARMQASLKSYYGDEYGQMIFSQYLESFEIVLGQFYNMLKEYRMESGGKITYQFVDLDAAPTLAASYDKYDVQSGTILFLCGERYQKLDLQELLEGTSDDTGLITTFNSEVERKVAAKINLVSAPNAKKATILTGHGEDQMVIAKLEDLLLINGCDVVSLDVTASEKPDEDTDVFVIVGPETDYTIEEVQKLMEWLDNDGKREKDLVVFTKAHCYLENLYNMFKDSYNIEVTNQLIFETDNNHIYNMDMNAIYGDVQETDYTKALVGQRALMPMANVLKIHNAGDEEKDDVFSKVLVSSSESAKVLTYEDVLEIAQQSGNKSEAQIQEEIISRLTATDEYPIISAAYTTARVYDNDDDRDYTTDVLIIGTDEFMASPYVNVTSACNEDLFLSVFRGLTGLETTISISSRELEKDYLDFGESTTPTVLGYVFVLGLPLVMIVLAIVVFVRRRRL